MKKYLTIDVGGSSIKYALMDEETNILEKGKVKNTFDSLDEYVEALGQLYDKYKDEIEGMACSMPGVIDPDTGFFYTGGAYDKFVHNINMLDVMHKRIPCNISIGNDAKCAGNAELGFGSLKDVDSAIVIVLGSGIGGCVILDHKVLNGKHFSAGEFSAINMDQVSGNPFTNNIWAFRNGSTGLLNRVNEALGEETKMDGIEIFERINAGDEKCLAGLRKFCQELAYMILNLEVVIDPDRYAIGGGISEQPILFKVLEEEIDKTLATMPSFSILRKPDIVPCKYNNDANLIGALYQYQVKFENK